jgi:hypothetical protein
MPITPFCDNEFNSEGISIANILGIMIRQKHLLDVFIPLSLGRNLLEFMFRYKYSIAISLYNERNYFIMRTKNKVYDILGYVWS